MKCRRFNRKKLITLVSWRGRAIDRLRRRSSRYSRRSTMTQYNQRQHVNFDRYQILQRHRAVSLPQHGFPV